MLPSARGYKSAFVKMRMFIIKKPNMFAYISASREDLLGVGTLVAMEIAVAGYALRKNIKRGCTIPHARACTHTCGRTAAADQEKMTQAVGSKLLRCWLPKEVRSIHNVGIQWQDCSTYISYLLFNSLNQKMNFDLQPFIFSCLHLINCRNIGCK